MKKVIIFLMLFFVTITYSISIAVENETQDNIYLNISRTEMQVDEELSFTINLANMEVGAYDICINFDETLFEYISGPENTNVINGKIITSWYDDTGGNNTKQNCELVKYTLKSKSIGNSLIAIQGEFYNEQGVEVGTLTDGIEIILSEDEETEIIEISEESEVASNNSNLKILRLNHEGITPVFSSDITEYYFLTENLDSLEVTAIPENSNAQVNITGNTNLKDGLNIISIEVISEDTTSKTEYTILVTKTNDLEKANANLETLAIENVTLEPEYINDIYQYEATISNTTESLNILAIAEKENANVQIIGGSNLNYGDNEVIINVTAENGYTTKKYVINVYRRNEEEQKLAEEEKQINIQRLSAILDEENEEYDQEANSNELIEEVKQNKWIVIILIVLIIAILGIVVYRIKLAKKEKNNK